MSAAPTRRVFLARLAASFAVGARRARGAAQAAEPPNVLIIVLDTVRYDRALAAADARMPRLRRLAARGVEFTNAWANSSWSLPSHASILTGVYPHEHGADWPALDLRRDTLAATLARHGYVTGGFSSNAAWVTDDYLGQGFLRFRSHNVEDHLRRTTHGRVLSRLSELIGWHPAGRGKKAPQVHAEFLQFLETFPGRPFFGYLCHMDANQAYNAAELNRAAWEPARSAAQIVAAYDQGLTTLDDDLADFFDAIERLGLLDRTIVVVTSDHGESFGRANPGDHDPKGHGTTLYPEQTRVPLIVLAPGWSQAGRTVDIPVGLHAIPSTISRLLAIPSPSRAEPLPLDPGWPIPSDPAVLSTLHYGDRDERAVATSRWLYRRDIRASREEIFDLAADPTAQTDLGASHPEMRRLREQCDRLWREGAA
jgi:arylsulfatase A-like enzyme